MLLEDTSRTVPQDDGTTATEPSTVLQLRPIRLSRSQHAATDQTPIGEGFPAPFLQLAADFQVILAAVLRQFGLQTKTVDHQGGCFRVAVEEQPQREIEARPAVAERLGALMTKLDDSCTLVRLAAPERQQIDQVIVRLLHFLAKKGFCLDWVGSSRSVKPPPKVGLVIELNEPSGLRVRGTIVSIDSRNYRVTLTKNQVVEGLPTKGLSVGQELNLVCRLRNEETTLIYIPVDPAQRVQDKLIL